MEYFRLDPEVAGGLGEQTVVGPQLGDDHELEPWPPGPDAVLG